MSLCRRMSCIDARPMKFANLMAKLADERRASSMVGVADWGGRKKGNCQGLEPRLGFFSAWAVGRVWKPSSLAGGAGVAMSCLMASKTSNIRRVTRGKAQRRKDAKEDGNDELGLW